MQKQILKTGDYGIGLMFHVIHMTDDVAVTTKWYEDVFGGIVFMSPDEPGYLPPEDRWAQLMVVSDYGVEVMAPNMPPDVNKPVGKFYAKFGRHLHSVGYEVDDLPGLGNRMIDKGIYIGKMGGGRLEHMEEGTSYFYPSPRDTAGLMVELCHLDFPDDPRMAPWWSSMHRMWETGHPLGIKRMSYVTLGCRDLDTAVKVYVDTMQAVPIAEGVDEASGYKYATVHLGDCMLQLAEPIDPQSRLGQHVEQFGNMIYSVTFKVADLDAAEAWLNSKNVRTHRPRPGLLGTEPDDCFGAPYFFTTDVLEKDPFEQ